MVLKAVIDPEEVAPLPKPNGSWPFRLDLAAVAGTRPVGDRMDFHMVGDTGSLRNPEFQRQVARSMAAQHDRSSGSREGPDFLLHLGDIVYDHGEASEYAAQFFNPFEHYPAPVFALAGNHDGGINPESPVAYNSLDAYMAVFCDSHPRQIPFAGRSRRLSMTQPNVYWTLRTPLANFICLYGNVTKFGHVGQEQFDWLLHELRTLGAEKSAKALFICLHHAPYSADTNHGSSLTMIDMLEKAYVISGVRPDLVFSGHVHNYQRFTRHYDDGEAVRYLVAGAGGYAQLHKIAGYGDERVSSQAEQFEKVKLEHYCDTRHGFLKMRLERSSRGLLLTGEYYTIGEGPCKGEPAPELVERFLLPLRSMEAVPI